MLSETLSSGLERYRIGPKIKALRVQKKLGLVQLGKHSGLSAAMLSKIERGQLIPTLPTLLRIALVFGVGLEHFFVEEKKRSLAVVRKSDRLRLPNRPGIEQPSYYFESLDFPVTDRKMEAYYAEFPVGATQSEPHGHDGAEFLFVLKGQIVVTVDDEPVALEAGDAVHFDSAVPHTYGQHGRSACAAIIVVAR